MKAQVTVMSDNRRLGSTVLPKEANVDLIVSKQKVVLFHEGCMKSAVE